MGALLSLLPEALSTFLCGKEVTVWMMSCGTLVSNPESYMQLAAWSSGKSTALVFLGEAESTYSISGSISQI